MTCNRVSPNPYAGGNNNYNQYYNPGAGVIDNSHYQQQQGFGAGQPNRQYNSGNNDFGHVGGSGQQWQSAGYQGERAEAYHTHVFNEPDRYGYDYTMPGGTVRYLMYKKSK